MNEFDEMKQFYRRVVALLGAMALVAAGTAIVFSALFYRMNARHLEGQEALNRELARLQQELNTSEPVVAPPATLAPQDLAALYSKGLSSPLIAIPADLMRHPEIIPFPAAAGGTMSFNSPQDIHVLNNRWVLAACRDSQRRGVLLLEYSVGLRGAITWKVVASALK